MAEQQTYGRHSRKKLVALVIIVVALIAGLLVWVFVLRDAAKHQPVASTKVCDESTISKASSAIKNNNIETMGTIADTIKKAGNYKQDIDCDYIMARYYIATGDATNAESTLTDIKAAFAKGKAYSTNFDPPAISVGALQDSITTIKQNQQDQLDEQDFYNATDGVTP